MHKATGNIRIARFLAAAGLGSRRKCEEFVTEGLVHVNEKVIDTPALNIDPTVDIVTFNGKIVRLNPQRYIALHKPRGYTCSARDSHAEHLVPELFPPDAPRLFTIGRLDRESEGLLLCTNDGDFAQSIAHPRYEVAKVYRVLVKGSVTTRKLQRLTDGVQSRGDVLKAVQALAEEETSSGTWLKIIVTEGKKREIRRMCTACGWEVLRLVRTAVGPVVLGALPTGNWRELTPAERHGLMEASLQPED